MIAKPLLALNSDLFETISLIFGGGEFVSIPYKTKPRAFYFLLGNKTIERVTSVT